MSAGWPSFASQTLGSTASIGAAPWNGTPANVGSNELTPSPLASPDSPANPMSRIRLATVGDVAKELKKLYRESRAGTLSVKEATSLAYLLNMLAGILTASDLEARLTTIEAERARR